MCLVAQLCPLFETPWTVACQTALSMGILQANILEWVTIPPSEDIPKPGIDPRCPTMQAVFYPLNHQGNLDRISAAILKNPTELS